MEGETERLFRSFFGPCVGVLCSEDGAQAIGRNGLTVSQLFQPFSTVNGDLTSRDMTGQLHSVSQAWFVFYLFNDVLFISTVDEKYFSWYKDLKLLLKY